MRKEKYADATMSETPIQIWGRYGLSLATFVRKNKMLFLGILIGALLVLPLTFHEYQQLDSVIASSDDRVAYNDMYFINFGEPGNASEGDMMLVCWFNVTTASHILIGVSVNEQVTIYRIGVLYHSIPVIRLHDTISPNGTVQYQLAHPGVGLYSCSVFYAAGNNSLVGIRVLYL